MARARVVARGHAVREGEFMRVLRLVPLVSGVVALWWMLGPAAAYAQEEGEADFGRTGFYIGVGAALSQLLDAEERFEEEFAAAGLDSANVDTKSSVGINGRVGYRFHTHLAAEVEGDWHSGFDGDGANGAQTGKAEFEPLVFTTNLKGYLFKDRFQPYGVVGIGVMTGEFRITELFGDCVCYSERFTGFAARFGGGADLYITEHIVLNAEIRYVLPTGAAESFDMISFGWGVQYRF